MNPDENKEIEERILAIYKEVLQELPEKNKIDGITYYTDITLVNPIDGKDGLADQNIYAVRVVNEKEKNLYKLYNNSIEIAEIDENGKIIFSNEYIEWLEQIDKRFSEIAKNANEKEALDLNNELTEEDKEYKEDEIKELESEENKEITEQQKEQEKEEPENKEQEMQQLAEATGNKVENIKSYSKIKPTQYLTDKDTFEEIANVKGQYSDIYIVNANEDMGKNHKFAFIGRNQDGELEYIEGLETKGTTTTDRQIYSINRDGSKVEEKQVTEMFTTSDPNKMFSAKIGNYGIIEVDYLRKSPTENKFVGSQVETQTERPTTAEVKQFMNEARTTKSELDESIDKTKKQIEENESRTTRLENIDDNPNNDRAIDVTEVVELDDGTKTTIMDEAKSQNKKLDDYIKEMEETPESGMAEKIESIRVKELEKNTKEEPEVLHDREDRGERETPEEAALRRLMNN